VHGPNVPEYIAAAHRIAVLAETDPDHPVILAVRLALEAADARREHRGAIRQAGLDIHSGRTPEEWRRWADNHVPHAEIERRRAEPGRLAPRETP
jgi:hypothetical protein